MNGRFTFANTLVSIFGPKEVTIPQPGSMMGRLAYLGALMGKPILGDYSGRRVSSPGDREARITDFRHFLVKWAWAWVKSDDLVKTHAEFAPDLPGYLEKTLGDFAPAKRKEIASLGEMLLRLEPLKDLEFHRTHRSVFAFRLLFVSQNLDPMYCRESFR